MKNPIVLKAMADATLAKVAKATELGTKTTWETRDHLAALAKALATATDPEHDEAYVETIRLVLEDGYNISAYQQLLEKAFEKDGHFQRKGTKERKSVPAIYAALGIQP